MIRILSCARTDTYMLLVHRELVMRRNHVNYVLASAWVPFGRASPLGAGRANARKGLDSQRWRHIPTHQLQVKKVVTANVDAVTALSLSRDVATSRLLHSKTSSRNNNLDSRPQQNALRPLSPDHHPAPTQADLPPPPPPTTIFPPVSTAPPGTLQAFKTSLHCCSSARWLAQASWSIAQCSLLLMCLCQKTYLTLLPLCRLRLR
ncbi:uncharacterized protein BDR25DRAFT_105653 [Lindgomyces ingoldianus]|uniref:Uncharacterized protein n=1 Tax=Lindgomyces ingoldianus TaxID=673940 RepID=A0ACB6QA51_9PLEO|nr:uncharacterized protein BDR25DRAFT_105653 [Lindgomyces ingoldianus]KAF2463834.1 hypothetical protein BDR25DRAFT_105653 [Lindgomyces ingoldianus]